MTHGDLFRSCCMSSMLIISLDLHIFFPGFSSYLFFFCFTFFPYPYLFSSTNAVLPGQIYCPGLGGTGTYRVL